MRPVLRLYEDVLSNESAEVCLPARPRMVFVAHGSLAAADRIVRADEAWSSERAVTLKAGRDGATLWRWGNPSADEVRRRRYRRQGRRFHAKNFPRGSIQYPRARCSCAATASPFPPGGCAYLHRHQGPGIRCLLEGGIRIDTHGRSTSYGPGGAWFESGPEPVFAQAADRPTRFIRVMILPLAYLGKGSVEYLNEEDKAKPKTQPTRSSPICRSLPQRDEPPIPAALSYDRHPCMGLGKSRGKGEANCYAMAANSMVGFFVRPRPFLRPDLGGAGAPRAAAVKAGRRPPPQAARSGLDGGEHGAKLSGRDDGSRDKRQDVILDWAVCDECANTASPCIRFGRETRYPNLSCTGESKAQNRRDPSERAGC